MRGKTKTIYLNITQTDKIMNKCVIVKYKIWSNINLYRYIKLKTVTSLNTCNVNKTIIIAKESIQG